MSQTSRLTALSAELETAQTLAELLEGQRDALMAQDIERVDEVTVSLQEQFAQLRWIAQARGAAYEGAAELGPEDIASLRALRVVQSQLQSLAELNQQMIADRLAYLRAVLSRICPEDGGSGYAPGPKNGTAKGSAALSRMTRSA